MSLGTFQLLNAEFEFPKSSDYITGLAIPAVPYFLERDMLLILSSLDIYPKSFILRNLSLWWNFPNRYFPNIYRYWPIDYIFGMQSKSGFKDSLITNNIKFHASEVQLECQEMFPLL